MAWPGCGLAMPNKLLHAVAKLRHDDASGIPRPSMPLCCAMPPLSPTPPPHPAALPPAGTSPLASAALPAPQLDAASLALLPPQPLWDLGEGLEAPIQGIYLLTLLGFLAAGAYLVVRQVRRVCQGWGRGCSMVGRMRRSGVPSPALLQPTPKNHVPRHAPSGAHSPRAG